MKNLTLILTLLTAATALAQAPEPAAPAEPVATTATTAATATTVPPPMPPILMTYRFWPEQFVQWIGIELPYSMIEFDIDEASGKPVYDVVLVDRATQKRTHYSNTPLLVAAAKAQETEAYLATDIKFVRADAAITGATYTLQFTMHDGKPLDWRFIQGSDIMEQGGGLSAFPASPIAIFAYREQAAVAGEGTVLQIGDTASNAEMWKEISKPPYFMAWHGAYSLNATTLVLPNGEEKWTIASAPTTLATGASWKLTTTTGRELDIRAEKVDGNHASLSVEVLPGSSKRTIDATWDGRTWHYNQVRFIPHNGDKLGLTLQFAPALSSDAPSNVDILVGKKKIVSAAVSADAGKQLTINFKSPDWVKSRSLTESLVSTPGDLTLHASTR